MKKRSRLPRKTLGIFIVSLLVIFIFHTIHNIEIITKQPSDNWSRSFTLGITSFNRPAIADFMDNNTGILIYPVKDGKGCIGITKVDKLGNVIDKYEIYEEKLNFNKAFENDIHFKNGFLFWRNYDDNTVYIAEFDKEYKQIIKTDKLFENIKSISVANGNKGLYIGLVYQNGKVGVFRFDNYNLEKIDSPIDLTNMSMVNLVSYNNHLYLQTVKEQKNSIKKEIWITEYENDRILYSKKTATVYTNTMYRIRDIICGTDANYIYSIAVMNGEEKGTFKYIIDGFRKDSFESFDTVEVATYQKYTEKIFTSIPAVVNTNNNGIELYTTAYTDLDLFNVSSNAIKITLEKNEIKDVELVSNTNIWSSKVSIMVNEDITHVFWLEPNGFKNGARIKGATNNKDAFPVLSKLKLQDVRLALYREIPVFSYLFLLLFATQLIRALPSIVWFAIVFWFYDKFEDKPKHALIPGIVLNLICQMSFMLLFYNPQYIRYFPDILTYNSLIYVIPVIISLLSYFVMKVYTSESDKPEYYKQFFIYFIYGYLITNYIYAPYLFMK
jgi:hypothetical protein